MTTRDLADDDALLDPHVERAQDQACLEFAAGKIDRATARARLIELGLMPEIVDEGLDEQEKERCRMPLYMCTACGSVDNTATGGYWEQELRAYKAGKKFEPLCSACNPDIGAWHGKFERRSAGGYVSDLRGFLYTADEATNRAKHMGPFKPVALPASRPNIE